MRKMELKRKYDELTVLEKIDEKTVKCQCSCGNVVTRRINTLLNNYNKHYCAKGIHLSQERKKYNFDLNFFKKETPELYWLLGLLASDGNVEEKSNRISISQSGEKGKQRIEFVKKITNSNYPIQHYKNSFSINFISEELKDILQEYNIISKKTYVFNINDKYNKNLLPYFYEGYIEGDGCVSIREYRKDFYTLQLSFVGTEDFIKKSFEILPFTTQITKVKKAKNLYVIWWTGKKAKQLYDFYFNREKVFCDGKFKKIENFEKQHFQDSFLRDYFKIKKIQDYINDNFYKTRIEIAEELNEHFQYLYDFENKNKIVFFFQKEKTAKSFLSPLYFVQSLIKLYQINKPLISLNEIINPQNYNNCLEKICVELNLINIQKGILNGLLINQFNNILLLKYNNEYIKFNGKEYNCWEEDYWNLYFGFFRNCRSVVIDLKNLRYILLPQEKFFNINQFSENSYEEICKIIKNSFKIEFSEKMDGSNQNYRYYNKNFIGSGSQALDKKESWRLELGYSLLNKNYKKMLKDYPDYTFMFELISPLNQIVVNYSKEQEGLYLFGIRNTVNGEEKTYSEIIKIAKKYKVKTIQLYDTTLPNILKETKKYLSNEKEGWVMAIYNKKGVKKVKVKTDDYVLMHKVLSKMISPNAIIEAVDTDRIDDLMAKIPLGQKDIATEYLKEIYNYLKIMREVIDKYYNNLLINLPEDKKEKRKTFMIGVTEKVPQDLRSYVINKYLGREKGFLTRLGSNEKSPGYFTIKEIRERVNRIKNYK